MSELFARDADGALHIVALSGGKDSTAMAVRLREQNPGRRYVYLCTPTGDELPELFDHWRSLGERLGSRIIPIMAARSLSGYVDHYESLPSRLQRWCTRQLKIEPYREFLSTQATQGPVVSYVGLRADEEGRAGGAYDDIDGVSMSFPLREWGWGEADVWSYLDQNEIRIPERTDCARCFYQTLGEWWRLWKDYPEIFASAEADEARTGHTWRTPRRNADGTAILTTRWPKPYPASWRDTWPVRLADMRELFALGYIPKHAPQQHDMLRSVGACRACSL